MSEGRLRGQIEDGGESAFTLNVPTRRSRTSAFQQISFNQDHDLNPSVMTGGRVLYTAGQRPGGTNGMHLYTMNPDGSDMQCCRCAQPHVGSPDRSRRTDEVQFVKARQMEDGADGADSSGDPGTDFGGNLVILDVVNSSSAPSARWPRCGHGTVLPGDGQCDRE